ncbi:MAG: TIGR03618 family F420-dependent PPOX class oxidoreductase [Actinophytocola sp.]|nr:TIGR03618 family F420-dependent PPOX class oxidoreductase [Actinophytocola sp.]
MDITQARQVLTDQSHAVLATMRKDGSPQLSPVLVAVDDDGAVLVSTRQTAYKFRNIRRDPRVWLCVLPDKFFGDWIQVAGTTEIVELPGAMDGLVGYYRKLSGEHPDWDEYRQSMRDERRVLLRITITEAGPDRAG